MESDSKAVSKTKLNASDQGSCSNKPGNLKKPCCVCLETKRVRDECIVLNGEERCKAFIDAHNACLKAEGFEIK
ncbi:unnamed protein product [Vitrella brassicaformis CCMP3155]|uniref:Cytochrome c oxidase copper chaperone n=1 Tax=Vitrella brassicaformis (strain CCMP3155) TaxID=1169540 RepID=A0A0G4EQ62_VITBC|nr:unnamed protein product [Vitrella brassicaformis CCMP3155]|eukprot:CEL99426.1 unnamed protein product [Vitrella brassicaformis CCMP3155]